MEQEKQFNKFVATEVALNSSNLIEASAGTGKTYSIAILVLRLILEKELSIKEVLMVTFTKAAVAELEERIRLFVRKAYQVADQKDIDDFTIKELVDRSISSLGQEKVKEILKEAKLLLDETSVMTIHSFCQQCLNEFAFETNQLFSSETMQDTSALIEDEVNKFWREQVTVLSPELLRFLLRENLNRGTLGEIITNHLSGQRFIGYESTITYSFPLEEQVIRLTRLLGIEKDLISLTESIYQQVLDSTNELTDTCNQNSHAKKGILPTISNPPVFLDTLDKKRGSGYVLELFSDWLNKIDQIADLQKSIQAVSRETLSLLYNIAIQKASKNIVSYKAKNSLLSFDDMIVQLHKALTKEGREKLIGEIRKKYQAVFIDEFQDTDKLQYEIFKSAFGTDTIIYYIGDPKQSIYAWRQADLKTYFKASHEVESKYGMNQNYRSSELFIKAMNVFFQPTEGFDAFYFDGEKDGIKYIAVDSPVPNRKGVLLKGEEEDIAITIYEESKKEKVAQGVCAQIIQLLDNNDYQIEKNGERRRIQAADIGILVRSKFEGQSIKSQLAKYGIPAITIDDSKVLESQESHYLFYLLNAFFDNSSSTINKALLSPFTGFNRNDILALNQEYVIEQFKGYSELWHTNGIYVTLTKFIVDYDVKNTLLINQSGNGERSITNLLQLIEILHKVQSSKSFSQLELINWLKRGMEGMKVEGDEFEQRIESDLEAIEIVTIHKSKGLEYNIVFAPYLDLKAELRKPFCSFKDDVLNEYLFGFTEELTDAQKEMAIRQLEQENRRLIYVAITRAVYKCFIYRNSYYGASSLSYFVDELQKGSSFNQLIEFSTSPEIAEGYQYVKSEKENNAVISIAEHFQLKDKYWRKLSYSFLAKDGIHVQRPNLYNDLEDYEYFIFKQLLKGNITGNLLHHIFENIDFRNNQYWDRTIASALTHFMPKQLENYKEPLLQLLEEVLNTEIKIGDSAFKLSEIAKEKRMNELEFDFNVSPFNTNVLNALSFPNGEFVVNHYGQLEGIMNGKIDLFFEHEGRYYLLDWKSNFLGDSLENYTAGNLEAAMTDNNYHLQYLIYTLATKRYLESRLSDFDYERDFGGIIYVFIRGVRQGSTHGVFVTKPDKSQIAQLESVLSYSDR